MVDLDRQIRITEARQGGFSAHFLGRPAGYQPPPQVQFDPRFVESEWLFDFKGLGEPYAVAGTITGSGDLSLWTIVLGEDDGPYLGGTSSGTGSAAGRWILTCDDDRIKDVTSNGDFKIKFDVWKPDTDAPKVDVVLMRNASTEQLIEITLNNPWPVLTARGSAGLGTGFGAIWSYESTESPYINNAWNTIIVEKTGPTLTWNINDNVFSIFDTADFEFEFDDLSWLRVRLNTTGNNQKRIRNLVVSRLP